MTAARVERVGRGRSVSWDADRSLDEVERMRAAHRAAGMREYPYPFGSALAITSDIDCSSRRHFRAYIGQIVERHGLDFGDSVWLHTNQMGDRPGLGLLTPSLTYLGKEHRPLLAHEMDHYEILDHHHRGNVDHWHSFLTRGPRTAILRGFVDEQDGWVRVPVPPPPRGEPHPMYNAGAFWVMAVSVYLAAPGRAGVEAVELVTFKDEVVPIPRAPDDEPCAVALVGAMPADEAIEFFAMMYPIDSPFAAPPLTEIVAVRLRMRDGDSSALRRVCVHNTHSRILLDRLRVLSCRFHWWTNLITTHAVWHFQHALRERWTGETSVRRFEERPDELETYFGSMTGEGYRLSSLADEPESFARVYPELAEELGLKFWRPAGVVERKRGRLKGRHSVIHDVLTPSRTRNGSGIYLLNSTLSYIPDRFERAHELEREKTTMVSFTKRVEAILDDFRDGARRATFFYTHVGNIEPLRKPRSPYFDEAAFERLRRLAHGIGYRPDEGPRLWFTRASVLADYALLAQLLPEHVERPGGDALIIHSWQDPLVGALPTGPEQLYGQTFYVEDAAAARVYLDDTKIEDLVRNPADETGRESVTIATCGIEHTVFDEVDPEKRIGPWRRVPSGRPLRWCWQDDGRGAWSGSAYGTISLAGRRDAPSRWWRREQVRASWGRLDLACKDMKVEGAQVFRYAVRRSHDRVRFGVVLETRTGGRFYFGDPALRPEPGTLTASRDVPSSERSLVGWQRVVVPLWDLGWAEPARDVLAAPLPSHPLHRLSIIVDGDEGDSIDMDAVSYGRPRTAIHPESRTAVVVGGLLRKRKAGAVVRLRSLDRRRYLEHSTVSDDLGGFVFPAVPRGGYMLTCDTVRRAACLECHADRFDVRL